MARRGSRTETFSRAQATQRLRIAEQFAQTGDLVASDPSEIASANVAIALYVLAGIAAADAICGAVFGVRSRGQDHRDAAGLLSDVARTGAGLVKAFRNLIDLKDASHYSDALLGAPEVARASRAAALLLREARGRLH